MHRTHGLSVPDDDGLALIRDAYREHPISCSLHLPEGVLQSIEHALPDLVGFVFDPTRLGVRYDTWRQYDPEDSLRFYALRMQETGLIKGNPQTIIAEGTDWRFLNELKRELKT
jgi:hypothetical protein